MKKNKGFTTLELTIVVFIIMILAAIAIPKFLELREKKQTTTIEQVQEESDNTLKPLE